MNIKDSIIAKRYALAYLNLYIDKLTDKDILDFRQAYFFLHNNKDILTLPSITLSDKLPLNLRALFLLVVKKRREYLLPFVLKEIVSAYQAKKKVIIFDISSADNLDKKDEEIILEFLHKNTGNKILPIYKIDKKLIAGIKIQSDTYYWEYSIKKQLEATRTLLWK